MSQSIGNMPQRSIFVASSQHRLCLAVAKRRGDYELAQ